MLRGTDMSDDGAIHKLNYVKIITYTTGFVGLLFFTTLIFHEGVNSIITTISVAGWQMLWVVPFHLLPIALDAEGWNILLKKLKSTHIPFPYVFWVASIRSAINSLLPVAMIGGEVVGIRLMIKKKMVPEFAVASVIVETTLTLINQYLFAILGVALLAFDIHGAYLIGTILLALLISLPLFAVFVLLQHSGISQHLKRLTARLPNGSKLLALLGNPALLDTEIKGLYHRRYDLIRCGIWQMAGLLTGAAETWFILYLLKYEISPSAALMIESLSQALRSATFIVPAGIGIQEASLVLLGGIAGLNLELAIALSLAKRFRDIAFGLPVLMSWQWTEGRHLSDMFKRKPHQIKL